MPASPPRAAARDDSRRDGGFSLVEMVVALVVFGLLAAAVSALVIDTLKTTRSDQSRVRAASLAAQEIETVRAALRSGGGIGDVTTLTFPWSDPGCATTEAACEVEVDGQRFTVGRDLTLLGADAGHAARLQVTTTVSWPRMDGVRPVLNSTVMTGRGLDASTTPVIVPPGGGSGGGAGMGNSTVVVSVIGSAGAPQQGVPVLLDGTSDFIATTEATGLAHFTFIPAGTYAVSATKAGFIDRAGNPSADTTVTVAADAQENRALHYAQAALVTYNLTIPGTAGTYPLPTAGGYSGLTTLNADLPADLARGTVAVGTDGTATKATWPTSSLRAWGGSCTVDQDRPGPFIAAAGTSPGRTIPLAALNVTVTKPGGLLNLDSVPLVGATVYAVKAAGAGCPATVLDPVSNQMTGAVIRFPNTTSGSGNTKLALPPGTWTIKVQNASLGLLGAWPTVTVAGGAIKPEQIHTGGLLL